MTDQELSITIEKYFKFLNTDQTTPVNLYLDSLAPSGKRSMRSLLVTAANIFEFEGELERMPWPLLQYKHFANVRSTLQSQGKSANTINLTLSACRGVMKACFNLGLIKAEQLMKINEVKRVRCTKLPAGRCLTNSETKALIRVCRQDKNILGKRDLAVIVMILSAGLRRSELIGLEKSDYNSRNGQLLINGKGNKQRLVFIQTDARKLIKPWLTNHDKKILFELNSQNVYDLLQKRCKQANIEHCSPHDLRRTFVTRLLESGIDINTVRQLAGHSDIQTTARYDLRDEKEQKRAMKRTLFVL